VNEEASHCVKLFGGNKIGNLTFWLPSYKNIYTHTRIYIIFTVAFRRHVHPIPAPPHSPHLCYGFDKTNIQRALVQFTHNVFHSLVHCVMCAAPYRTATNTLCYMCSTVQNSN